MFLKCEFDKYLKILKIQIFMPEIVYFAVVSLLNFKFLFSQEISSPNNIDFKEKICAVLPSLQNEKKNIFNIVITSIFESSGFIDITKNLFIIVFKKDNYLTQNQKTIFLRAFSQEYKELDPLFQGLSFERKRFLMERLENFEKSIKNTNSDSFPQVQKQIDEINDQMKKNITKIMVNQEDLKNIEKKSELLHKAADKFKSDTREYYNKEVNSTKCFGILIGALVAIIFIVLIIIIVYYNDTTSDNEIENSSTNSDVGKVFLNSTNSL